MPTQRREGDSRPVDFVRQIATISAMRDISMFIATPPESVQSALPTSLAALLDQGLPPSASCDGWGRPIIFFSSSESFVMLSFGRNGTPEAQQPWSLGGRHETADYDADIVVFGTAKEPWSPVQVPVNVDH
jgi:hypothetical protein